jgi:hypothetical protein
VTHTGSATDPVGRPRVPRDTGLRSLALLSTVSVLAGLLLVGVIAAPPGPSEPPAVPSPPSVPIATPIAVAPRPVVRVPASIDATGATDVTVALQAFFDAVPDGSTVQMTADAVYWVDGTLRLTGRHDIDLEGAGATIEARTIVDTNRRNISLRNSTWIRIANLTIRGANPTPGVLDEAHQFEHGISIEGGSDIEIASVTIENPRGDCIYVGDADGTLGWAARISIHDSVCRGPGRNGVAIVAGRDIRIESNTFQAIGLHVVDIEPNRTDGLSGTEAVRPVQGAANVAVIANRIIGPVSGYFFAANGWGPIDGLNVLDNVLKEAPLRITIQPLPVSGFIRSRIVVRGNRSDTPFDSTNGAAMSFTRNVDLTVRDNVGPLYGPGSTLIEVIDSCRIDIGGNRFPGGALEVEGAAGACPVLSAAAQVSVGVGAP